jgi:hypothetical protein
MQNGFTEKRAEPRTIIDEYYTVEFLLKGTPFIFQLKVWDLSFTGRSLLLKDNSVLLKYLEAGEKVGIKYYKASSRRSDNYYLKSEIKHITKCLNGRFEGYHLLGLSEDLV